MLSFRLWPIQWQPTSVRFDREARAGVGDNVAGVDVVSGGVGQVGSGRAHAELDQRADGDRCGVGGIAASTVATALRSSLARADGGRKNHRGQQ